ncbi:MAG: hypothetical protein JO353_09040, partial [Phycisphaerae bacterium]|nr:hypothetical protein [Phycisphaerae bacterium]
MRSKTSTLAILASLVFVSASRAESSTAQPNVFTESSPAVQQLLADPQPLRLMADAPESV